MCLKTERVKSSHLLERSAEVAENVQGAFQAVQEELGRRRAMVSAARKAVAPLPMGSLVVLALRHEEDLITQDENVVLSLFGRVMSAIGRLFAAIKSALRSVSLAFLNFFRRLFGFPPLA